MNEKVTFKDSQKVKKDVDTSHVDKVLKRLSFISLVLVMFFLVVCMRLTEVSLKGGLYGIQKSQNELTENKKRGSIVDRNGHVLATNIHAYALYAYPSDIIDPEYTAEKLTNYFSNIDYKILYKKITNKEKKEILLKRGVVANKAHKINSIGLAGLQFRVEDKRFYPKENLVSHLVGHVDIDMEGSAGIEKSFNKSLSQGENIKLTLDVRIQHAVREELIKGFESFNALSAMGIVVNVNSGEILSTVNIPDYNPNSNINPKSLGYSNASAISVFEMGSIYKMFTVAAALENKIANIDTLFDARKPIKIANHTIKDYFPKNKFLTMREVFLYSSNIGSSLIAASLGANRQREFLTKLGLLDTPSIQGVNLITKPITPKRWGIAEVATISYGYGISVTPIQLASVVSTLVNGGYKIPLNIVSEINNYSNKKVFKRVVSLDTSKIIRSLLKENVESGTAKRAKMKGYEIGGKTATSEKINSVNKYDKNKRLSSFIAIFPVNKPKYLVFVLLDEPNPIDNKRGHATGGWTAVPVTANIIKRIAPLLDVTRQIPIENLIVDNEGGNLNLASY